MITQEQYNSFIVVRDSGVTNMIDTQKVSTLMGNATPHEVKEIISNFDTLDEQYQ